MRLFRWGKVERLRRRSDTNSFSCYKLILLPLRSAIESSSRGERLHRIGIKMRVWESVIDPPPQTFREDDAIPQVIPKALRHAAAD